jgi:hypothetical protein
LGSNFKKPQRAFVLFAHPKHESNENTDTGIVTKISQSKRIKMIRKSALVLATTFTAGLLFVNVYNSWVDAVSWGSNIPTSIVTAREYFRVVNPGSFFRLFSPVNQALALFALVVCWKMGKKVRVYSGLALLFAVLVDVFTFGFFYPRNEIMFAAPIDTNLEAIKTAWSEWSNMNWVRSGVEVVGLAFDFAALSLVLKAER